MYFDGLAPLLDVLKTGKVTQFVAIYRIVTKQCPIGVPPLGGNPLVVPPLGGHLFVVPPSGGTLTFNYGKRLFLSVAVLATLLFRVSLVHAEPKYLLSPASDSTSLQRVRVAIEIQGELKTNPDGKKVSRIPLAVNAALNYEEKVTGSEANRRAARYYEEARADLKIKDNVETTSLHDDHRLILVRTAKNESVFLSPLGPLTRDELDLLDVPGNSSIAPSLLPGREVKIGESWTPEDVVLASLLGLEAISKSDATATLTKVDGETAIIDMAGFVQGAVGGVATEIELKAKLNFDLADRRLTWLAMALKENRSIGHAEPGFETVARVRVAMQPVESLPRLTDKLLADLPADTDSGAALLKLESPKAGFRVLYDKRWRVMVDRSDVAILRLVERGDLIAQCNISPLPESAPGKHLSLEEFKGEIEEALGKNFGQIVEAKQSKTESGLHVLRIVASGVSSELPIQWIYYHVSSDGGRRAAYVFTMEARLAERFGAADEILGSTFEFITRSGPTPAAAASEKPTAGNSKPATTSAIRPSSSGTKSTSPTHAGPARR